MFTEVILLQLTGIISINMKQILITKVFIFYRATNKNIFLNILKIQMLQQINRGELEKTIYCMTSLMQNVQIRQIYILQKIDLFCIGLVGIQAGFRKGRGTRDHIASICWVIEKAREFQKNIYLCFVDYAKAFDFVDQNKLWKILKQLGTPDHLTCLSQVRKQQLELDMNQQTGPNQEKEYIKAVYCHPACLIICRVHHEKCWAGGSTS